LKPRPTRVVVFGMPRTATTAVQRVVADHYGLENLGEIGTNLNHSDKDPKDNTKILRSTDRWCAKFLSQVQHTDVVDLWQARGVDCVIITRRKHLADAICSLHIAGIVGRYHHEEPVRFLEGWRCEIPKSTVEYWIQHIYQPFEQTCRELENTKIPVTTVLKEDFESGSTIIVADDTLAIHQSHKYYLEFRIDYPVLVQNYDQIRSWTEQFD